MRQYKANEVCLLLNISIKTLDMWYLFKRENPDNEYAKLLPNPTQSGPHRTRYWEEKDIPELIKFQATIKQGRNGFMGAVTQRFVKKV